MIRTKGKESASQRRRKRKLKAKDNRRNQQRQQQQPKKKQKIQKNDPPEEKDSKDAKESSVPSEDVGPSPFEGSKEKRKTTLQLEEEIALYEASLEILKSRKQEVLAQLELKQSQKHDVLLEQFARMEQKKGLKTAQVRHLQLLQELRKSLSKSQERLKRLISLSSGILSEDEIAKLKQELSKPEAEIATRSSSPQDGQIEQKVDRTTDSEPRQNKPSHPSGPRAVWLKNIYGDKQKVASFWRCQGEPSSKSCVFLPCIHSESLLVRIMDISARETLLLDALDLYQNHRREALESSCLDLGLCTSSSAILKQNPSEIPSNLTRPIMSLEQGSDDSDRKPSPSPSYQSKRKEYKFDATSTSPNNSLDKLSYTEEETSDTLIHNLSHDSDDNDKYADAEDDEDSILSRYNMDQKSKSQGSPSDRKFEMNTENPDNDELNESLENSDDDSDCLPVLDLSETIEPKATEEQQRTEDAFGTTRDISNKTIDSDVPLCPYELAGVCADAYCPYQHLQHRKHGKMLPRELLPLPKLKLPPELPPEPPPANQATQPIDNLIAKKCELSHEKVRQDSGPSVPLKSIASLTTINTLCKTCPESHCGTGSQTCTPNVADKDETQQREKSPKKQCDEKTKNDNFVHSDKRRDCLCIKDPIFANEDFVSLKIVPSDSFEAGEESDDDDIDLVTAYLDDVGSSRQKCIWWMTPEHFASLQKLSVPISLIDWLRFGGFRITGRKKKKFSMEIIDVREKKFCHATILLGSVVDCFRLAIHAGRFDVSEGLLDLADQAFHGLQTNKVSSKSIRDVIKCLKRVGASAFERQTSFCATFDLQLLLAIIAVFVRELHDKHVSTDTGLDDSMWAKDLFDICRALQPPNAERGQKVIRSHDNLVSAIRHNLFQLSPTVSGTLDLCSLKEESKCGCLKILSLLSDVRLGKSCGLNMSEASSLSALAEDILQPIWSIVRSFLRQHSSSEDREAMYLKGCILIGYIVFGTLQNIYNNFGELGSSAISVLKQVNSNIQRILLALREAVADEPFLELLLTPLFAGCVSLSTFLRLYSKAQHLLETFLWARAGGLKDDSNRASGLPLSGYSELLWSQLVQLRASLPFCEQVAGGEDSDGCVTALTLPTDIRECHNLVALRIKQYGIHLHHLSLAGDWNLLRQLNTPTQLKLENSKINERKIMPKWIKGLYNDLIQISLSGVKREKKSFNLSNVPLIFRNGKDNPSSNRSAFPQTLLVAGEVMSALKLSACSLANIPVSFGMYFSHLKKLDLSCNQLRILPDSIGLISCLQDLNVSRNELALLPETIGSLESLRNLDLSNNSLQQLPLALRRCKKLEQLNAVFNFLSPAIDIFPLTKLTKLRMLKYQPQSTKTAVAEPGFVI